MAQHDPKRPTPRVTIQAEATSAAPSTDAVDYHAPQLGEVAEIDAEGRPCVVFPGNALLPVPARSTLPAGDAGVGARVVLLFEAADPERPIITGVLQPAGEPVEAASAALPDASRDVRIDGERLVFDARQEIVLRCGKSTLVLQKDGKVLIRGTHLVSRSSGPNRIKGGSISLN